MAIKTLKKIPGLFALTGILLLFTACPYCDLSEGGPLILLPDQMIITPDKKTFNTGDVLTIEVNIPSKVEDMGNSYDIYKMYGAKNSTKSTNISKILQGNPYTVGKGKLDDFQIILSYSKATDAYQFKCEVTLKRKGVYKRYFGKKARIGSFRFIEDKHDCEYIGIRTTIKGSIINEEGYYEFTVE